MRPPKQKQGKLLGSLFGERWNWQMYTTGINEDTYAYNLHFLKGCDVC